MSYCGEYKRRMSSWNGLKNGINYVARVRMRYRKIPKISPWAFIFQRPFLRGLIFGGDYVRREIFVSKLARLILGGKFTFQYRLGWLIVGRKVMSVICRKFLLKLALRT